MEFAHIVQIQLCKLEPFWVSILARAGLDVLALNKIARGRQSDSEVWER